LQRNTRTWRAPDVRVLLSSWGSRGDIEPLAALALRLRERGAEVRACAPPDEEFAALFERAGVTVVPLGPSTRSIAAGLKAPSPDAAFRLAAELVAARFETLPAAAAGCDVMLATGLMPAGARSVAEKLGIGVAHDGPVPTASSLGSALGTALVAETRERAAEVAAQIRPDGALVAAERLLDS
jgi:UDP:flavonoid glycosyltransferase YjiC (YdhE family)